ncbi:MAG: hypothetical protein GY928_39870 [Colwellia sp.]|nr:hypothetical protein [Colwellia sp.]
MNRMLFKETLRNILEESSGNTRLSDLINTIKEVSDSLDNFNITAMDSTTE